MKKTTKIIALLLCAVMMLGIFAGCQNQDPTTTGSKPQATNPSNPTDPVIKNWKDEYTADQIKGFYNTAIKIGYTESFKYTTG